MLVNIRIGTIIDIDGETFKVTSAGTPLLFGDDILRLELTSLISAEVTNVTIHAPVATDGDLGKIREVLEHTEEALS